MRKYCKAYHLGDLRQFPGWREATEQSDIPPTDDTIVYLWDDLTVVTSPIVSEQGILWEAITPQWQDFCKQALHFEIPEDLRYAYEASQEHQGTKRGEPSESQN